MKESVAIAKEADAKKEFSPTKSDKSIPRVQHEPERQLGSLRSVIDNIRRDGGTPSADSIATELSSMYTVQRASVLLALQRTHGNRYVQRVVAGIQAKLKVGQQGDIYEQEADRVADAVMRMPGPQVQPRSEEEEKKEEESIQTKPLSDQITPFVQREVEEEKEILQAKEVPSQTPEVAPNLEARINATRGGGQPLPASTRAFFEPRFGYNFSQVRVHNDAKAAELARVVNARVFTTGRDIVFGNGQYALETGEGRRLLAHELTHVVQQGQDNYPKIQRWKSDGRYTFTIYSKAPDEYDSTGHAFLSIENTEGNEYYYGFYPECKRPRCRPMDRCTTGDYFKMMVGVPGIVCDDRGHSFTSSLDYQITEDQFRAIRYFADEKKSNPPEWELLTYNCVDFATQTARAGGIEPPSSGWFVFTPAELEKNILRAPQEYKKCLLIKLERAGGMPSEKDIMEAVKKCSEETGYSTPNISEEEAFEHLEEVRRGRLEPKEKEEPIQAKQFPGQTLEVTSELESRIHALKSGGQPLPEQVCAYFEPRFGYDFNQVRVHTDAWAAETVRAVNARAFTVGRDVVFGAGQYALETGEGRRLLAHELTHTIQQTGNTQQTNKWYFGRVIVNHH